MKKLSLFILLILFSCSSNEKLSYTADFLKACYMHGEEEFEFQGEIITEENCCEECVVLAINRYCGFEDNFLITSDEWWYEIRKWTKESEKNKIKLLLLYKKLNEDAINTTNHDFKEYIDFLFLSRRGFDLEDEKQ